MSVRAGLKTEHVHLCQNPPQLCGKTCSVHVCGSAQSEEVSSAM